MIARLVLRGTPRRSLRPIDVTVAPSLLCSPLRKTAHLVAAIKGHRRTFFGKLDRGESTFELEPNNGRNREPEHQGSLHPVDQKSLWRAERLCTCRMCFGGIGLSCFAGGGPKKTAASGLGKQAALHLAQFGYSSNWVSVGLRGIIISQADPA